MMRPPSFWFQSPNLFNFWRWILTPLGVLYQYLVLRRQALDAEVRPQVPVICVGNITLGGAGKTPTVIALVDIMRQAGWRPAILSRGYGGSERGPYRVKMGDLSSAVGDEALLLSKMAPCYIARNRPEAASLALSEGANLLLLDDGFQNPALAKTASILVFEGESGLGNQRVFPAGPLRQTLKTALPQADICLIIGKDKAGLRRQILKIIPDMPLMSAYLQPQISGTVLDPFFDKPCLAFAGIGRPQKFYTTLEALKINATRKVDFADHYAYQQPDLEALWALADGMPLITTEKDWVRLPTEWQNKIAYLPVKLMFEAEETAHHLLKSLADKMSK